MYLVCLLPISNLCWHHLRCFRLVLGSRRMRRSLVLQKLLRKNELAHKPSGNLFVSTDSHAEEAQNFPSRSALFLRIPVISADAQVLYNKSSCFGNLHPIGEYLVF